MAARTATISDADDLAGNSTQHDLPLGPVEPNLLTWQTQLLHRHRLAALDAPAPANLGDTHGATEHQQTPQQQQHQLRTQHSHQQAHSSAPAPAPAPAPARSDTPHLEARTLHDPCLGVSTHRHTTALNDPTSREAVWVNSDSEAESVTSDCTWYDCEFEPGAFGPEFNHREFLGDGVTVHNASDTQQASSSTQPDAHHQLVALQDLIDLSMSGEKVEWPSGLDRASARDRLRHTTPETVAASTAAPASHDTATDASTHAHLHACFSDFDTNLISTSSGSNSVPLLSVIDVATSAPSERSCTALIKSEVGDNCLG